MKTIYIPLFKMDEATEGGGSGGGGGNSGASATNTNQNQADPSPEITKERERLQSENAELRKKQKATEDKMVQLGEELANLKKSGAKGVGDWKKVAEDQEKEIETLKASNTAMKEGFRNTLVGARLREEALKQGAKADMVDLIDSMSFDEVDFKLDDQAMKFSVSGVETAITNLKKVRPSFFDVKAAPKFNNGNGGGQGGGSGATDLEAAKSNYLAAHKNRIKDPAKFNQAHLEYQKALTAAKAAKK